MHKEIPPNISVDSFLNGKLKIYQSKDAFKSGSDAVFLSAFVNCQSGQVLEAGCGTGVVSLCLAARCPEIHITGIDIERSVISMAQDSAACNNLSTQCQFICSNISDMPHANHMYNAVVTNPPYFSTTPSPNPKVAKAKNQSMSLRVWIKESTKQLKSKGYLYLIYPTEKIDALLQALEGFGNIHLFPLWSKPKGGSKRILVRAQKNTKKPATLHPGLVIHENDGNYTQEAQGILREGQPITL